MSEMEYSTKNHKQVKYRSLWNIEYSRNIQKKRKTAKIFKILEYGIFHWIFLKYYKHIYIYIYIIYIYIRRGRKVLPG